MEKGKKRGRKKLPKELKKRTLVVMVRNKDYKDVREKTLELIKEFENQ